MERALSAQLSGLMGVMGMVGWAAMGPTWGLAAAVGVASALVYYRMLAFQTRRAIARGFMPGLGLVMGALVVRQFVCLAGPLLCLAFLGPAWFASVATMLIARHWILIVAWSRGTWQPVGTTPAL